MRWVALTAVLASAAVAGIGLLWLIAPGSNPTGAAATTSLVSAVLGSTPVAVIAIATGGAGIVVGAMFVRSGSRSVAATPAGIAAAAIALASALTLGSVSIVAFAGYLFGCLAVVAGVVTIGVMSVRTPRLGLALLAGLIGLLAASVWLAGLTVAGVVEFASSFGAALVADAAGLAVSAVTVTATLAWATLALIAMRTDGALRALESWLVRHRRALTILAALGPVPYAVARISWLTPWPLFGPNDQPIPPPMLATGLMLGAGAVAASILTLGLIMPWGRVFPDWIPGLGGRSVPILAATVPGFTAAAVLCVSAVPMLVTMVGDPADPVDALIVNLVLPFWFWGPMLALAVWAYSAWREEDTSSTTGRATTLYESIRPARHRRQGIRATGSGR